MALSRPTGFPVGGGSGNGLSTITVVPANVGDLIIVSVLVASTSITVTGMSGGNAKGWTFAAGFTDATSVNRMEIWVGTATATGSASVTVTYSGSVAAIFCEIDADSLHSSVAGGWSIVAGGGVHDTTTLTPAYPALTATLAGQAYWGILTPANTPSAGATSGFTYNLLDTSFVITAINTNVSAGSVTPAANQSPTGVATAIGVILAFGVAPNPYRNNQAIKRASLY